MKSSLSRWNIWLSDKDPSVEDWPTTLRQSSEPFHEAGPARRHRVYAPGHGIEAPALDTRERLRQISPKAGLEVEDGVDSAAQVHVDEREHGRQCRVSLSLIEYDIGVKPTPRVVESPRSCLGTQDAYLPPVESVVEVLEGSADPVSVNG